MKINKLVDVDLNILSPQKHIRIHEGDVDSVDILIGVSVDDETVDLDGITIKYDATINNYLAEQDADGSVVDDKISIPVTQNMTAMSGLLLIDVRMIQSDQILFTQTICATVEKAVVNGSTYIDLNKITIIQRMNALEEKMDYIEELVENFDTSKLIVSTNRPPSGAPAELDVDLLRVGDTWILSGNNIVYKLVEAQYNYQPVPSAEPYHKFTWQPLNERYGVGNIDPPTAVTYQPVVYTINEVQWSWLPVPEYSRGDHYQMLVDGESTYYICKSGTMASTGVCTYIWREEGGGASSGITIINTETVPESAEWGDSIPASYAGNTGKAGEIAYWEEDGYFWGLFNLATDPITGNINYNWVRQADEIDISDLKASIATKMKLAPLNPTAKQIAALPSGQLYVDTVNHKGIVKDGQEFYDTAAIDALIPDISGKEDKIITDVVPPFCKSTYPIGTKFLYNNRLYEYIQAVNTIIITQMCVYRIIGRKLFTQNWQATPPSSENTANRVSTYRVGDLWSNGDTSTANISGYLGGDVYICTKVQYQMSYNTVTFNYSWKKLPFDATTLNGYGIADAYTKTEVDALIPDISGKEDKSNKVTSFSDQSTDDQYPSAKAVYTSASGKENISNKVTSLSAQSTDTQYPSAKCVYDMIGDIESLLAEV